VAVTTCCWEFERYLSIDVREIKSELGIVIFPFNKEPPHYNPRRPYAIAFHGPDGRRLFIQITFCPWCGHDLNRQFSGAQI
jgi:hypothetical protein